MDTSLITAIKAALKAGVEILEIYNDPQADFQIERKADNSPLTIADKKANAAIMDFLKNTPYPVLSEEEKALDFNERKKWETLWIVDPLDGTKEFIKRNGEFTVNIALVNNGTPIAGVIYIPVKQQLYFASDKEGAYRIDGISYSPDINPDTLMTKAQRLPLPKKSSKYTVVASRSHMSQETQQFIQDLDKKYPEVELVSVGSSIKICLVAEGNADVYPRFAPTMEWDTAAGHAIAKAAGKEIYIYNEEKTLRYNKEELQNPWFIVV